MIVRHLTRILRAGVFALVRFSGLPYLIRETWQRNNVTILVYHALEEASAEVHFAALRSRYNVISLSDFLLARSSKLNERLPPKSLIITFDDGHESNYRLKSLIQRYRIPITIFLCSGIVGTKRHFWWFHTKDGEEAQRLKAMPDEQRAQALLRNGHTDVKEYEVRQSLAREEIAEMKSFVDFQSHTVFHPILSACSDKRARKEIAESKKVLENEYGLKIYALAYPNGNYSEREIKLLQETGYSCGLTLDAGFNDFETDPLRLRRVALPDDAGISEVLVKASGLWSFLKTFWAKSSNFGGSRSPENHAPPSRM